jgi:hypothetical protein
MTDALTVTPADLLHIAQRLGDARDQVAALHQAHAAARTTGVAAQPEAVDLTPVLKILIPLLPLLKPVVRQLVLDNLDPALDALFKAIADAAARV